MADNIWVVFFILFYFWLCLDDLVHSVGYLELSNDYQRAELLNWLYADTINWSTGIYFPISFRTFFLLCIDKSHLKLSSLFSNWRKFIFRFTEVVDLCMLMESYLFILMLLMPLTTETVFLYNINMKP